MYDTRQIFSFVCVPLRVLLTVMLCHFEDELTYRWRLFLGTAAFYVAYSFYRAFITHADSQFGGAAWFHAQRPLHVTLYIAVGVTLWSEVDDVPWILLACDIGIGAILGLRHFGATHAKK